MESPVSEKWLPIPGYEGLYEVSSIGRVRSLPRYGTSGGIRKLALRKDGYFDVALSASNVERKYLVHRLVAVAFCERNPGEDIARHLNDVRTDNHAENLAWGTLSDNSQDCLRNGRHFQANQTSCKAGHPFDEVNTYVDAQGYRNCRTCRRNVSRAWMAAKRRRDRGEAA